MEVRPRHRKPEEAIGPDLTKEDAATATKEKKTTVGEKTAPLPAPRVNFWPRTHLQGRKSYGASWRRRTGATADGESQQNNDVQERIA
jgi:hypothetical protein